jgi:hypothetical protein
MGEESSETEADSQNLNEMAKKSPTEVRLFLLILKFELETIHNFMLFEEVSYFSLSSSR